MKSGVKVEQTSSQIRTYLIMSYCKNNMSDDTDEKPLHTWWIRFDRSSSFIRDEYELLKDR